MKIAKLTLNHLCENLGLEERLQCSWAIESERRNTVQAAYRLQCAAAGDFSEIALDTGWIPSAQSQNVLPECGALKPLRRYCLYSSRSSGVMSYAGLIIALPVFSVFSCLCQNGRPSSSPMPSPAGRSPLLSPKSRTACLSASISRSRRCSRRWLVLSQSGDCPFSHGV